MLEFNFMYHVFTLWLLVCEQFGYINPFWTNLIKKIGCIGEKYGKLSLNNEEIKEINKRSEDT